MDPTTRLLVKLVIAGIVILAIYLLRQFLFRKAAISILEKTKLTYAEKHEWREVNVSDFPQLDQKFYVDMTGWLASLGYRHMGDAENVTLREINPKMKHCLRYMLSPDGTINAAIYHIVAPGHSVKVFDLMSEFSDGDFVETSNATEAAKMDCPPQIHHTYFSQTTAYDQILVAHLNAINTYRTEDPQATPIVIASKEDIRASGDRMQAIKSAFRKTHGVVTSEEVRRIGGMERKDVADGVVREIERLKKKS